MMKNCIEHLYRPIPRQKQRYLCRYGIGSVHPYITSSQCASETLSEHCLPVSTQSMSHLCKVEVHQAEGEELEAHGEAVEQPEGEGFQGVGRDKVLEVEREEYGAQGRPQQAQGQEGGLVAEALVAVPQHQPELDVDEGEEEGVEDGIDHRQTQSDVRRHGRAQSRKRHGLVHQRRLLSYHRGLHDLLSPTWRGGGSGAEGQVFLGSRWKR